MRKKISKITGLSSVISALLGNLFITVVKFIGFFVSGSSVMFSEVIHSSADTANQALLMVGITRSRKKADAEFVYGYGQERFLWALISACGIFFLGAGVTIYNGVEALRRHEAIHLNKLVFITLGISLVVEAFTFALAVKELMVHSKEGNFFDAIENGDPATLAVLYEDGMAVLGVLVAFFSIIMAIVTGDYYYDAAGSIIVGLLMAFIAVVLIKKNMELLTSKAIPEDVKMKIVELMEAEPSIEKVIDFKSSILDVGVYRIKCEVEFNGPSLLKELYNSEGLREEYDFLKDDYQEFVKFCADYVDRVPRLIGSKINKIEERVQAEIPEVRHIDIEIN